ncbi:MAG: hypothetical protein WCO63_09515 [Bacteroidota bacterium]
MKKAFLLLMKFGIAAMFTVSFFTVSAQQVTDTLKEKVSTLNDQATGLNERVLTNESDLAKLNKIKVSGYVQAQVFKSENPSLYPSSYFSIRRARIKFTYEAAQGVVFVLQPDLSPGNFALKDAYVVMNDRWTKQFALTMGQFNRPNYEVEYSSSQREVLERSRVILACYPGERAIGAKLEFRPTGIPLKVQAALFNGNDAISYKDNTGTAVATVNKDIDNFKDLMVRATYSLKLQGLGGLDFGAHGYFGGLRANTTATLHGDYKTLDAAKLGDNVKRSWVGVEFQFFADILGGMAIKGEYLFGQNANSGYKLGPVSTSSFASVLKNDTLTNTTTNTATTTISPNFVNKFSGYYVYLIKNVGKKNQFVARYDYYDPNSEVKGKDAGVLAYTDPSNGSTSTTATVTSVNGSQVLINKTVTKTTTNFSSKSGKSDLAYGTLALAWQYYFDDNIRVTLQYDMPMNEKSLQGKVVDSYTINGVPGTLDYSKVFKQNTITLRIQAKF